MKKLIFVNMMWIILVSINTFAHEVGLPSEDVVVAQASPRSLDFQMQQLSGNWNSEGYNKVIHIRRQDDSRVFAYFCDRAKFEADGHCEYSDLWILTYASDLDAVFNPKGKGFCSSSFQVSLDEPHTLVITADPRRTDGNCGVSGQMLELQKIK